MRNKMDDLRNHLFVQLEKLADEECDLEIEAKRAAALVQVAAVIIDSAKVETEFLRVTTQDPINGTGFFHIAPKEPPLRLDESGKEPEKTDEEEPSKIQRPKALYSNRPRPSYEISEEYKKKTMEEQILMFPFTTELFYENWHMWKKYKKDHWRFTYKSVISEQAALNHLYQVSNGDVDEAIKIVNYSISQGWKGLFQINEHVKTNYNNNRKPVRKTATEAARDYLKQGGAEGFNGSQGNQNSGGGSN